MKTPLDNDLNKVYRAFNQNHDHLRQKLMASLPECSKQHKRAGRINHALAFIGGSIMRNRITKLATAAAIIIVILIGIRQFGVSIDVASVVWADVVKNVEQIQTFTCRAKIDAKGMEIFGYPEKETEMLYNSLEHGRRVNTYTDDETLFKIQHWISARNEMIVILPAAKKYACISMSQDLFDPTINLNPREFLKEFMSFEHIELGRRKINGMVTEGIEVNDPKLCYNAFENVAAQLWVDVETNLPVQFVINGSADDGAMQLKRVFDGFVWDVDFDAGLFEPNIPPDYTLIAETKIDNKSEDMVIEGLRNFAEFSEGQYPSSLVLLIAGKEIIQAWHATTNWGQRQPNKQEHQQIQSIHSICFFHAELDKENKDVAYYGRGVTAEDADAVLMRWKVSDNEYRVIYGDLTSENISAAQLAELENDPGFITVMQRPRKAMKVQGIIGIDISKWPTIKVAPGMPAEDAGVQSGDVVIRVNGKDVSHITTSGDALKILRGPAGEMLSITVKRDEQVLDFNVERVPLPK